MSVLSILCGDNLDSMRSKSTSVAYLVIWALSLYFAVHSLQRIPHLTKELVHKGPAHTALFTGERLKQSCLFCFLLSRFLLHLLWLTSCGAFGALITILCLFILSICVCSTCWQHLYPTPHPTTCLLCCQYSENDTQFDVAVPSVAGRTAAGVYPHGSMVMGVSPGIRPGMTTISNTGPPTKKQAIMVDTASQQAQASLADKNDELRQT